MHAYLYQGLYYQRGKLLREEPYKLSHIKKDASTYKAYYIWNLPKTLILEHSVAALDFRNTRLFSFQNTESAMHRENQWEVAR